MTFEHGLVIGKFYPLHNGHLSMITRASQRCRRLTVIVMASQLESISLDDRLQWTIEATTAIGNVTVLGIPDDAPVDYSSDNAWAAHVEAMEASLRNRGIPLPDAVFGGETYVEELGRRLGAEAVVDDRSREIVPMSATAARADLAGTWQMLPPSTRRGMATRIIVVGAESTGTTTLANALFERYSARVPGMVRVDEYGREFTYELAAETGGGMDDLVWRTEHFALIAQRQAEREDAAVLAAPLVIADTDAFATSIWERRYVGAHSHGAEFAAGRGLPRRDLYLVTDHVGVRFEQDGWRDGEDIRPSMTRWFIDGLTARGLPWILVRGGLETRVSYASEAIDALYARRTTFA